MGLDVEVFPVISRFEARLVKRLDVLRTGQDAEVRGLAEAYAAKLAAARDSMKSLEQFCQFIDVASVHHA